MSPLRNDLRTSVYGLHVHQVGSAASGFKFCGLFGRTSGSRIGLSCAAFKSAGYARVPTAQE